MVVAKLRSRQFKSVVRDGKTQASRGSPIGVKTFYWYRVTRQHAMMPRLLPLLRYEWK